MAKGSGMIHPNMATMLGFFSCDAGIDAAIWRGMVRRAVQRSFNAITVDGDTSTNDTVLAFPLESHWLLNTMPTLRQA
jgi:glutamate N-acetyltransferase/amino-acid N-acetyltransferase